MRKNRNFTAGILLALATGPVLFAAIMLFVQCVHRQNMEELLETKALTTIQLEIDKHKLVVVRSGEEVLIDGKLFDVKSISSENGKTILTGIFDSEEDRIVQDLVAAEQKEASSGALSFGSILLTFLSPFSTATPIQLQPPCPMQISNLHSVFSTFFFLRPCFDVAAPPPDC